MECYYAVLKNMNSISLTSGLCGSCKHHAGERRFNRLNVNKAECGIYYEIETT